MPKRTNEKQEVIALLRRLLARQGCSVTESKMLKDQVTGAEREVDVVMECAEGDVTVTVSFEVLAHGRPADITWVEQQQKKHERLATNKLVLVSWSGFTGTAVEQAKRDPKLLLVTPELVTGSDGNPSLRAIYAEELGLSARKVVFTVLPPGAEQIRVAVFPDNKIFQATGVEVGTAKELAEAFLNSPDVFKRIALEVHSHPERDKVVGFVIGSDIGYQVYLRKDETGELHRIKGVEVTGDLSWKQEKVDLAMARFGDVLFGHAKTQLLGRAATVVATLGSDASIGAFTTRVYEQKETPPKSDAESQ
jgi:hypothetical protein